MANKRKCKWCKDYSTEFITVPAGTFCTIEHAFEFKQSAQEKAKSRLQAKAKSMRGKDAKAAKNKPKRKIKTIAKVVDDAAVLLQKLVRIKAADSDGYCVCVTCGSSKHWKEMQGGHFISRRYTATKIMEENISPQCQGCNGPRAKDGIVTIEYTNYMVDFYGREFVDELLVLKNVTRKYTRDEIAVISADFKEQIKYHEDRLAGT